MNPFIINDETPGIHLFPPDRERGLEPGLGYGTAGAYRNADAFPSELLIPESEWVPRVQERQERQQLLRQLAFDLGGVKIKDQNGLPYCWIFATTLALEIVRALQNQPYVSLSPSSCGAKITGYRKRGGYGGEAIEGLAKYGAAPSDLWPDVAVNRQYDTLATEAAAKKYRVTEWWQITDWPSTVSALLHGLPVSAGYNWWGHQVCLVDLTILDGEVCPVLANSWSTQWMDNGFGTLQGRKKVPNDAVVPRVAIAS